jgi:competence protein ComEC
MIVSHDDRDHAGGLRSIIGQIPVSELMISPGSEHHNHPLSTQHCETGQRWQWDQVNFEILHPAPNNRGNKNNRSCVLRISNSRHSVLLTGDIEASAERKLMQRHGEGLQSDVMLSPHHGSRTSSSPAFLRSVAAKEVIHSIGYRNRFHHPNKTIVQRYRDHGFHQLRTDQLGMIRYKITTEPGGIERVSWREQKRRPWQRPMVDTEF